MGETSGMWKYSIESYQWTPREGAWQPAKDHEANTWFLFGEKGGDKRVFGLFESRSGAEDAVGKLMRGELGDHYKGALNHPGETDVSGASESYDQMLAEASKRGAPNDKDKGIDR